MVDTLLQQKILLNYMTTHLISFRWIFFPFLIPFHEQGPIMPSPNYHNFSLLVAKLPSSIPKPHNSPDLKLNVIATSPNFDNCWFVSQPIENWASSNRKMVIKPTLVKMIARFHPWFVWHFFVWWCQQITINGFMKGSSLVVCAPTSGGKL
jgi:hypothetical protein